MHCKEVDTTEQHHLVDTYTDLYGVLEDLTSTEALTSETVMGALHTPWHVALCYLLLLLLLSCSSRVLLCATP